MYNYIDFSQFSPDDFLVYLRKSRSDDPLLSVEEVLAKHEAILDEWCEKNLGAKVPEENKYREVVSGETIADRPKMQEILKKMESPKIKGIIIVEVQRLSRGDLEDAGRIIKLFRYTNTLAVTPQKAYDIRDEYDRDAFERELKRGNEYLEYTKKIMSRGRLLSVSQGNYIGSEPPYGYDKIWVMEGKRKCPTLAINEDEANVVRMIFDMYVNKDMGRPSIAKRLDSLGIKPPRGERWSPHALKDLLENVHYLGKVKWNWRKTVTVVEDGEIKKTAPKSKIGEYLVYDGKHPAIISDELFNAALEKQGRNHRTKPDTKVRNPFASLLYCQCGRAMRLCTYKHHGGEPRLTCNDHSNCHTGSCTYADFENYMIDVLKQCIADFEIRVKTDNSDSIKLHEKLLKDLEKKMQALEAKEIAQWEAQANPDPSQRMPAHVFAILNEKLLKEKDEVKEAMCNARKSMPEPVNYQETLQRFTDALNALLDPERSAEDKNRLLKDCIERIDYNRAKPERIKSQQVYYYDKEKKRTRKKSTLTTGGNWTNPPMEIEVKLKV